MPGLNMDGDQACVDVFYIIIFYNCIDIKWEFSINSVLSFIRISDVELDSFAKCLVIPNTISRLPFH